MFNKFVGERENDITIVLVITLIYILNVFSVQIPALGVLIGTVTILILLFLLFDGQLEKYALFLILIMTTSFEVSAFALEGEEVYSFLKMPILGSHHITILSLLPILTLLKGENLNTFWRKLNKEKGLRKYNNGMFFMFFIGIILSLVSFLLNDNGVQDSSIHLSHTRQEILGFFSIFLLGTFISILLVSNPQFSKKLEELLKCILLSLLPSALITIALDLYGFYDGNKAILLPLVCFFGVVLMIFPFYSMYSNQKKYFINGFILFLLILIYPSPLGGKWWLLVLIIPFVLMFTTLSKLNTKKLVYINFLVPIIILIIIIYPFFAPNQQNFENELSQKKFEQATSLFYLWQDDWFDNLPNSPKFRVDEFINIMIEFREKPQYLLFGKGFGGSITQHTNYLNWNQTDAFSTDQIIEGRYFKLHFALNKFFLKFGLFGLLFYVSVIIFCLANIKKNPWILIGLVWFFMFFDYYISLYFGLFCLLLGLYKVSRNEKKNN